jgi:hypothetical protein
VDFKKQDETREPGSLRDSPEYPRSESPITRADASLDLALDRIYRVYGADLCAFFRDVEADILLERREEVGENKYGPPDAC